MYTFPGDGCCGDETRTDVAEAAQFSSVLITDEIDALERASAVLLAEPDYHLLVRAHTALLPRWWWMKVL